MNYILASTRAKIFKLRCAGHSYTTIAERLSISKQRVHQVLTGYISPSKLYRTKRPLSLRIDILQRDGFQCVLCGRKPPETVLHIDHRIPSSKGGTLNPDNLQTLCKECNSGKQDVILEYRKTRGRHSIPIAIIPPASPSSRHAPALGSASTN